MGVGRKTANAKGVKRVRDNETVHQKRQRLEILKKHARYIRCNESEEKHEHRLFTQREHAREARASETDIQTQQRLASLRGNAREARASETDKQTQQRLASLREHVRNAKAKETAKQRESRLIHERETTKNRRKLTVENFHSNISIYADVPCTFCRKMLYLPQRCNLKLTETIKLLLPPEFNMKSEVLTCYRCSSNLKKRKTPPQVYWNNMEVPSVPECIECLTVFEKRLLSRVVPFLKILKLSNRYSQQWCKGQAVLFAQDVEELAEQLPLPIDKAGLVIIAESLENVQAQREFSINMERLKISLSWLISNNPLYRNVRAAFSDAGIDISDVVDVDKINEPQLPPSVQTELYAVKQNEMVIRKGFTSLNDHTSILRGSFHQGDMSKFSEQSRGRQCTAVATIANVAFAVTNISNWTACDIDLILLAGDRYYRECMDSRIRPSNQESNTDFLAIRELLPTVHYSGRSFNVTITELNSISGHLKNDNSLEGFPNLKNGILAFFVHNKYGILTANWKSIAIGKLDEEYLLYDSHARGPKGFNAPIRGTACCMKFNDVNSFCGVLLRNLLHNNKRKNLTDNQYTLTPVNVDEPLDTIVLNEVSQQNLPQHDNKVTNQQYVDDCTCVAATSMLMSIDDGVPFVETVVDISDNPNFPNENNAAVSLVNIHRKTAPPLNVERERRFEELAWFYLYPHGINGFGESRPIAITALDYFQARIMGSDRRFQINDYLVFCSFHGGIF